MQSPCGSETTLSGGLCDLAMSEGQIMLDGQRTSEGL